MPKNDQTPEIALAALEEKSRLEKMGYRFHITPHNFKIQSKEKNIFTKKTPEKHQNPTTAIHPTIQYHKNLQDSIAIAKIHEDSKK